jgi:hypothetical protein
VDKIKTYGFDPALVDNGEGAVAYEVLGVELVDADAGGRHV